MLKYTLEIINRSEIMIIFHNDQDIVYALPVWQILSNLGAAFSEKYKSCGLDIMIHNYL